MNIYVSVTNKTEDNEWGYESDVTPRVGEILTYSFDEEFFTVTGVSHRMSRHPFQEGDLKQGVVDVEVIAM